MTEQKPFDKKWLIIIAILVLIAIIAVTIILCLPGNPKSAIQALQKDNENNIFADRATIQSYDSFESKIKNSVSQYSDEVADVQIFIGDVAVVVDKYNDLVLFFQENENFYDNYKPVTENLTQLQNTKNSIIGELKNVESNLNEGSKDFLRASWINMRAMVSEMTQQYLNAFISLNQIFVGSYSGIEQNLASQTFFKTINDYLVVINDSFKDLCKEDTLSDSLQDYSYDFSAVMDSFNNFIAKLQTKENSFEYDFVNYYFNETVSANYQKINEFYTLYKQDSFVDVIKSAKEENKNITFTKTFDNVEDTNGVYTSLKSYLGGQ